MYRKYLSGICVAGIAALLAGCGSSSSSSTTAGTNVTGLTKRVLISVVTTTGGEVLIVDGQKDALNAKPIAATQPSKMLTASGTTLILNSTLSQITIFNNSTELVTFNTDMQGQPFDIALSPDGQTAYAAIRNVGVVEVVNTQTGSIVGTMTIPSPARLVEGPKGHKLLAFADNPQVLPAPSQNDAFFLIDTGTNTFVPIQMPAGSQPYTAVFDPSDTSDTTAFILNCGTECGGSAAPSVAKVNFANPSSPQITFVGGSAISGATVGLLSGSSLFVAGTPSGSPTGTLQVINTGSLTAGSPISITNGLHTVMATTTNGRLYIGATQCTPGPVTPQATVTGCLSIFNTSTQNVIIPSESSLRQNFDVTGFQQISNRNVMYVVQGGELDFFDITSDAVSSSITIIDIQGKALDVLQIDP